jgi:hypothetical protein
MNSHIFRLQSKAQFCAVAAFTYGGCREKPGGTQNVSLVQIRTRISVLRNRSFKRRDCAPVFRVLTPVQTGHGVRWYIFNKVGADSIIIRKMLNIIDKNVGRTEYGISMKLVRLIKMCLNKTCGKV